VTSIHETVQQSLNASGYGQYQTYAAPVITALVDREHQIVGHLVQFARDKGLSEAEARQALAQCGMDVPTVQAVSYADAPAPAVPTPEPESDDPVLRMLGDIQRQLASLTQFARDNGYQG
jgi:pyrimidine deaminase RibD-like protein